MRSLGRVLYASISRPNVSITPAMYNAAFEHLKLEYVYASFDVKDPGEALRAMRALGIRGYSVSRPYKTQVISGLDDLDDTARAIGAVNVVENRSGRLVGHNTDWIGAVRALEALGPLPNGNAVVIGAGGAARAAVYGLKTRGADVIVLNRTESAASRLAAQLNVKVGAGLADRAAIEQADILVNATPVGARSSHDKHLIPSAWLRPGQRILDMVFEPVMTQLVVSAEDRGCQVARGVDMLVQQGAVAFEILTGEPAPVAVMLDALLDVVSPS